jgi:hypothetical protein
LCGGLRGLGFGTRSSGGILSRLVRCRLCLSSLFLGVLRLAARLLELLLRRAEFVFELSQLALKIADLTLDRFNPIGRSVLRMGRSRGHRGTNCD